ncbi:MAG: ABC transporter ATP-binding protein [Saprospiraceae bacterium]|jgi:ATP-binding cassette subfamily B multidrug efflux pump|uniref:ABC transporter ATP-binding protein n=1 Tax=Candidatus Brachybacter algidus TaxID=2982024 RepID=UPI001B5DDE39|nr:ABC transporter ATP-binding protein [Candidatus Brachybacter algidus]MBP7306632.1 ABC transporter ATP-binding protein [Saprospiraceae bacterium]MBK6373701.1 ABC transporter ATP-binding protein [Candidatus Brachybacter algidus]MBK6450836.1 ABC transporter ATP-binding protein [Candidatus Brachybacter algidus]MBK7604945.1 ABC transporter ATP-binding protein [Candidatus Brachybacter algidus]MBK8604587.1 ABC transporter ATP-binding protein [Candidatus Brachybacter algidus]
MFKNVDIKLLWRVVKLSFSFKKIFYLSLALALLLAPLGALRPYLVNIGVDKYVISNDLSGLFKICIVLVVLVIIESLLRYVFSYATDALGQYVTKDLRIEIFNKIVGLRVRHFDQTPTGMYITRVINDIENIKTIFSEGMLTIIADFIAIIVIVIVMFMTSWQLTLACLVTLPLMVVATIIFNKKVKVSYQRVRTQLANMNAFLQEHISGMTIIQAFNAQDREANKFKKINKDYTKANLDSVFYYAVFFPVVDIISAAALGLMVWWGARGIMNETVSLGAMVAFPIYLNTLFRPIRMLADKFNSMQMGLVAAERIFALTDDAAVTEDAGQVFLEEVKGNIVFDHVNFEYVEGSPILRDVSFEVPAGKTMAIVGSTGSGKSTIINLLTRFYDYEEGSITLDGVELNTIQKVNLRSHISLVLQDVFLFSGSVRDNITLNNPDITEENIQEASKMLDAHRFIMMLPDGYDFVVSERGHNLSSGQRQLISLVRALVYNPSILILDEATASIDSETEEIVQYAIEKLLENRSAIIIAHRLSTIRNADEILVLEHGRILERGSHSQLLEDPASRYSELYTIQFEKDLS